MENITKESTINKVLKNYEEVPSEHKKDFLKNMFEFLIGQIMELHNENVALKEHISLMHGGGMDNLAETMAVAELISALKRTKQKLREKEENESRKKK